MIGLLAALALGVLSVFVLKDVSHLKRRWRLVILGLTIAGGVMLIGVLLGPKLIRTWRDPQKQRCLILVDGSRSMLLTDRYGSEVAIWLSGGGPAAEDPRLTRQEVVRRLLADEAGGSLEALSKEFELSGWRFASAMETLPLAGEVPFEVDQEGYTTALGQALHQAALGSGGQRPQAIILVSDGAWNTGRDPSEVARLLGRLSVPVFVVGIGDPQPPRDVALLALRAPRSVLMGQEIFFTAQVAATGMESTSIALKLFSGEELVAEKEVITPLAGRPVNVNFSFVPEEPGRHVFSAAAARQAGEEDDTNNTASASVEVLERKISVLVVESEPRWEFRYLRNVLERDPSVSLTICLLRPGVGSIAGEQYLTALPTGRKELAAYELLILGDVPRRELPEPFLKGLAEMVRERSAALVVVAGRREHYKELVGTPLASILPVTLEGALGAQVRGLPTFRAELTHEGIGHLITRLEGDAKENEAIWSRLPPLRWSASVAGLVRGARALLVHPHRLAGAGKLPVLAVHRVGGGKVMFCGIDETWRWRKSSGDKYHYRFWAQVVRWMVKKHFSEGDPHARLSIDRSECDVGESVEIEAYCLGPDGFPLEGASVWLKVEDLEGESQRLAMDPAPGGWGIYRTQFMPKVPGKYRMKPIVSTYGREPLSSAVSLEVTQVNLEKNFLAQDLSVLTAVAQASGGRYLRVSEANLLPSLLAAKVERRNLSAEYSPCQHWAYYLVLALIFAVIWLIRKRSGLA